MTRSTQPAALDRAARAACEASSTSIVVTNRNGTIVWVNEAGCRLTGYSREELIGKNPRVLSSGRHDAAFYTELWSTILNGKRWTGELWNRRKNGEVYADRMLITPVCDDAGVITHFVALKQDLSERNQLLEDLAERSLWLQVALQTSRTGLWEWTPGAETIYYSPECLSMLGYSPEDEPQTFAQWQELMHPDDREGERLAVERFAANPRETYRNEFRMRHKDGSYRWILSQAAGVVETGDKPLRMLGTHIDITDLKQLSVELEASQTRLKRILETSPSLLYIFDETSRQTVFRNHDLDLALGYPKSEESSAQFLANRLHPKDRESVLREWHRVLESREDIFGDIEFRLRHADGSWRWFRNRFRAFERAGDGAVTQVIGTLVDITESHNRLQELRIAEVRSARAQQMASLGHWEFGAAGDRWWSEQLCGICRLPPCQCAPSVLRSIHLVHRLDRRKAIGVVRQLVEGLRPFQIEVRLAPRDGSGALRHARVTGEPQFDERNELLGFAGTVQDITATKDLEQKLTQSQRLESLGGLAGGVAHDFNNLLTVINGYAELMAESLAPEDPMRATVNEVRNAGEKAGALTKQLLAFSRTQVSHPAALDLNEVLRDSERMLRRLIREDIRIETKYDAAIPAIHADSSQIIQVIVNLTVNARDAMPDGGQLRIETGSRVLPSRQDPRAPASGRYVVLTVSDTGVGMDDALRSRIFDPFFTTKTDNGGTGLGLSTVYGIMQQAGGWIEVETAPQEGARFSLYFPECAAPAKHPTQEEAAGETRGQEEILVVEDQADVRALTCEALRGHGYRIREASSGHEALAMLRESLNGCRLLVSDVVMPGMSGPELYATLRAKAPQLRALFVSGYAGERQREGAGFGPDTDFLPKPFSPKALARRVRKLLDRPARPAHIVVVDEDAGVRGYLRDVLAGAGYRVTEAQDEAAAQAAIEAGGVDLLIADLAMTDRRGSEIVVALHARYPGLRMIVISGAFGGSMLRIASEIGAWRIAAKPIAAADLLEMANEALASP